MNKVVSLAEQREKANKPKEYCFTCPCQNQSFTLRPDARIECSTCGEIQQRLIWGQYFESSNGPH